MSKHSELAVSYFKKGFNCSQSVVAAFAEELGVTEEMALRLSCGFGGGVGRLREVCGAFTGLTMVLSTLYTNPSDPEDKSRIYEMIQGCAVDFKAESYKNSVVCRELLGLDAPEGVAQAEARTEAYYKKRPCVELVALGAGIAAAYIEKHPYK